MSFARCAFRSPLLVVVSLLAASALFAACGAPVVETPFIVVAPQSRDILVKLNALDGVDAFEIPTTLEGYRVFSLTVAQPQEHAGDVVEADPSEGALRQRMILHHRTTEAPMVMATTGYDLFGAPQTWADYRGELTRLGNANQLIIEHRFFGESIPLLSQRDWTSLTVANSAADSHRIRTLLGEIYSGAWIGTGVSKGGMTTIFHHVLYPDDLDGIVPYVAPISFGLEDARYVDWLQQIGPADGVCAERVRDIAVALVARIDEVAPLVEDATPGAAGLKDDLVTASVASAAFGFVWEFWQKWGTPASCAALPDPAGDASELSVFGAFSPVTSLGLRENTLEAYGYQLQTELGGQAFDYGELVNYLDTIDWSAFPPAAPPSWPVAPTFNPQTMLDIDTKLRRDAENVLAVYGAWDPWSAGQINLDSDHNSYKLVAPEVGHAARISSLSVDDRAFALEVLTEMMGVELDLSTLQDPAPLFSSSVLSARVDPSLPSPDRLEVESRALERLMRHRQLLTRVVGR